MKCEFCEKWMDETNLLVGSHYRCGQCGHESVERARECCDYPQYIPTKFYEDIFEAQIGHNDYLIYNQCRNCGNKKGTALKKSKNPKKTTPTFDYHLWEKRKELSDKFYQIKKRITKEKIRERHILFQENYLTYMESDEWKAKRMLVLKRDGNLCQECKVAKAEDVHHITYDNFKNEKLEDLVSVCRDCHKEIHIAQRKRFTTTYKNNA